VHAWLPSDIHGWRNYPALLVDICKGLGEIQFIVAYLYDRHAVSRRLRPVGKSSQWKTFISLWSWPQASMYVVSNQFESVHEWELRTWSRSNLESISTRWAFNIHTNRLETCKMLPGTVIGIALDTAVSFLPFLELPCEVRDQIYDYMLWDERQNLSRSCVHTRTLLRKRQYDDSGWSWHRELSMPTLGPLPRLQTPNIFLVCKQIRQEALNTVYRTKVFVISATSSADIFYSLDHNLLPLKIDRFLNIRADIILDMVTPEKVQECLCRVASLLQKHALSLQFLKVRIGFPELEAFAAFRNYGLRVTIKSEDIAGGMLKFVELVKRENGCESMEYKPLNIRWGVDEFEKNTGDFSCACRYLCADSLSELWRRVRWPGQDRGDLDLILTSESCQNMGCKLHRF
jgi:hypothetical protein